MTVKELTYATVLGLWLAVPFSGAATEKILADFEGSDYAGWTVTGEAFGTAPARGALPSQMPIEGYAGKGLVNSFLGGDPATGTLTSPEFTIDRGYLNFLIGGGGHKDRTAVNLLIDGKIVRSATGPNTAPGGSEALAEEVFDLREFAGKQDVFRSSIRRKAAGGTSMLITSS
jgi:fructan beta-fructosidase